MEWSANVVLNTDNMRSTFMISKNNQKIEVETSGNVEWKKSSSVFTKTLTVKTPFAGCEKTSDRQTVSLGLTLLEKRPGS